MLELKLALDFLPTVYYNQTMGQKFSLQDLTTQLICRYGIQVLILLLDLSHELMLLTNSCLKRVRMAESLYNMVILKVFMV